MKQTHAQHIQIPPLSTTHFSEAEIIELTEKFLAPGFHRLKSSTPAHGRAMVTTLLKSLKYYHATGYLSLTAGADATFDIYQLILQYPELSLHELMCSYIYCDFLWIEVTPQLLATSWYPSFIKSIYDLKLDTLIPIIMVSQSEVEN